MAALLTELLYLEHKPRHFSLSGHYIRNNAERGGMANLLHKLMNLVHDEATLIKKAEY